MFLRYTLNVNLNICNKKIALKNHLQFNIKKGMKLAQIKKKVKNELDDLKKE